jgi:tetratricopeptide (TPR) repeat protein
MSQKNQTKAPVIRRPSGGIPWWIWLVGGVFAVALVGALVPRLFPTDPQVLFNEALVILESPTPDLEKLNETVETLKTLPEWTGQVKYIEARMEVGRNMPLKAIPKLIEAMKSDAVRGKAGLLLGRAYGTAGKFEDAVSTLTLVLDDPEVGDDARFIAASILANGLALQDAYEHVQALKKSGYKPAQVYQQEGDILMDYGRFEEAAVAYRKSLDETGDSPVMNNVADRYLTCLVKAGKLSEADQYVDMIEDPSRGSKFQALALLGKGKITEALTVLDSRRREMPLVGESAVVAAKVCLAEGNVEKIKAELPSMISTVTKMTRNRDAFETLAEMASKAGNEPLANSAKKNAEQLKAIEDEFRKEVVAVSATRNDVDGRLKVASLAIQCGEYDYAKRVLDSLVRFFPEAEAKANAVMPDIFALTEPLAPLEGLSDSEAEAQPKTEEPPAVVPPAAVEPKLDSPKIDEPKVEAPK